MRSPSKALLEIVLAVESLVHFAFEYANVGYTFPVGITQAITTNQEQRQCNFRTELASIPDSKSEGV